jgi:hypothetical protein
VEDAFYQHEEGLLNDAAFATVLVGMRGLARFPGARAAWGLIRRAHTGRFADFMDDVVARGRQDPLLRVPSVDEWRADFAAEAAGAPQ